jgi:leucyl-tRNA synthetase
VLHDLGLVSTREPFKKLYNQGMIGGEDGQKMSKSRGNVVNPDDVVEKFGADSFRVYEMFMGPLDKSKPWNTKGLQGAYRFLQKVWRLCIDDKSKFSDAKPSKDTLRILHQTIKKVTEDLDKLSFNTAVSQMMIFTNHMLGLDEVNKKVLEQFLIILNPFAPHITEEIHEKLFFDLNKPISNKSWPIYDKKLILSQEITIAVQVNGKTKGSIIVNSNANEEEIYGLITSNSDFSRYFVDKQIIKEIFVPGRLVNFVIK